MSKSQCCHVEQRPLNFSHLDRETGFNPSGEASLGLGWNGPGLKCTSFARRTNINGKDDLCNNVEALRTIRCIDSDVESFLIQRA